MAPGESRAFKFLFWPVAAVLSLLRFFFPVVCCFKMSTACFLFLVGFDSQAPAVGKARVGGQVHRAASQVTQGDISSRSIAFAIVDLDRIERTLISTGFGCGVVVVVVVAATLPFFSTSVGGVVVAVG